MPEDETQSSTLGDRLGFGASATEVDPDWLNLFRLGEPLEKASFGVTRPGEPVPYGSTGTDLSQYRIGDLLLSSSGSYYLLGDEKPERLSDFAGMVYGVVEQPAQELPGDLSASFGDPSTPAEWPSDVPQPITNGALCAVLHPATGADATFSLATNPTGAADPYRDDVRPGRHAVDVEPSAGAYVLSGSGEAADAGNSKVRMFFARSCWCGKTNSCTCGALLVSVNLCTSCPLRLMFTRCCGWLCSTTNGASLI